MTSLPDPRDLLARFGIVDARAVTRIPGGFGDSAIWRVETHESPSRTLALRLFGVGDGRGVEREAAAMRTARHGGVPVPAVLGIEVGGARPAMLMEWCSGRTMLEELLTRPDRAWALGAQLGNVHGRLHICDPDPVLRERGVDWISWMGTGEPALQERLHQAGERSHLPATVLHLDFHPANVLVRSGRVTGVIDWANAGVGDLRADVARTASILRFGPVPPGLPQDRISRIRRIFRRAWRLAHRRTHGFLPDMELFDAWALAAMVRDLGQKVGRDNAAAMGLSEEYFGSLRRELENRKRRLRLA